MDGVERKTTIGEEKAGDYRTDCVRFPSIQAYRHIVDDVRKTARKMGLSDLPTITFKGTVKMHGANVGVGLTRDGRMWVQSRRRVISPMDDYVGVATHMKRHNTIVRGILERALKASRDEAVAAVMYGEWVGRGVQKGVALSEVDPIFVALKIKQVYSHGDDVVEVDDGDGGTRHSRLPHWLPEELLNSVHHPEARLYNKNEFPQYSVTIDFANPAGAQEQLDTITADVERCCPVGKFFGVEGTGEGVVWVSQPGSGFPGTYTFKVKGEKHAMVKSSRKQKTLTPVDMEQVAGATEFAEYAVTPARCEQGVDEVFTKEGVKPTRRGCGAFIKWMVGDVDKEEGDVAVRNNVNVGLAKKAVSTAARKWFFAYLEALSEADAIVGTGAGAGAGAGEGASAGVAVEGAGEDTAATEEAHTEPKPAVVTGGE